MGICGSYTSEWYKATSFDDLIEVNLKWINNEIKTHYFWGSASVNNNLASESHEIKHHLITLNKLGFMTFSSQPGKETSIIKYSKPMVIKQRAFVSGFMEIDKAKKVYNKLKDEKVAIQYFDESKRKSFENYDNSFGDYSHVTAAFGTNNRRIVNISETFFGCPSNIILVEAAGRNVHISKSLYDKIKLAIVPVAIMDMEWGRKDYLWDVLIKAMRED